MELYGDRPASVYDNLKTPTTNIRVHTSTPKSLKIGNTVASPTVSSLTLTAAKAGTATATSVEILERGEAAAPKRTIAANGLKNSPININIPYKFDKQQHQTFPCLNEHHSPTKAPQQPVALNFTAQAKAKKLQFPTKATASPFNSNSNGNINNYTNSNNNTNQHSIKAHANDSNKMPASTSAPSQYPATLSATTYSSTMTTSTPTISSQSAAPQNACRTQRPLSQHSQSELNESSQSIAAVKAALNDAKSKFFGLNGYAGQEHQHSAPSNHINNNNVCKLVYTSNPNESRLKQEASTSPRLLIDNQFPKVQIVTTAPTPPPKSLQPKYQNIPENSAIFRNNQAAQQQPPELPPKPVEAIATPSRMTAPTSLTETDGVVSETPNSAVFSSSSAHSSISSPTSPLDAVKLSLSPSHATYQQIPLTDIDTPQPSQAVYMSTTVPQNIKGSKIAGRHTPTRNSLRHSRMLVVNNKTYPATQHPNPMNFKYPNLARWLLILEIIVGLLISFLAIWIFCLAPNTAIQYNPYWSGLVLLMTGILGLVLVRYQRIKRHKVRENCFKFLRADLYLLALLAVLLCSIAFFCAALHYARLNDNSTHCAPSNPLVEQGSCTCTFDVPEDELAPGINSGSTAKGLVEEELVPEEIDDQSYKVEYWDLSCKEVSGEWTNILIFSSALNSIAFLLAFAFAVLLVGCRHNSKRFYTSVHTSTF